MSQAPISYARQDISEADIEAVVAVLKSDFLTQGPAVPAFEKLVGEYVDAAHAIAVNSATSALHIACLALGVGKGDVVWTSPVTFLASSNCVLYCGATVDFVDIDPRTYNLSVERLAEKLAVAKKAGKLPKVVIPVHMCGQPCDMARIYALAQEYGFRIIEDAAHAIGAVYKGERIGNGRYSDITVFSFHPVKIITSGEGGMALTNDAKLGRKLGLLRSHGITSTRSEMQPRDASEIWNYQQVDLGFNYRMTDIHAALGLSQMTRLDAFLETRRALARRYDQLLAGLPVRLPWQHADGRSSYHLYPIRLRLDAIRRTQRQVYDALRADGVLVNVHYIPVYRQPFYEAMGFQAGYCPEAESYHRETISIPLYAGMTRAQQDRVVAALKKAIAA